jgi:DNA primase
MQNDFSFDVEAYLADKGVKVKKRGKDVGSGWIGIPCPFPQCSDTQSHCGIHIKTQVFKCWICGEKGHAVRLIEMLEDCSWPEAMDIARRFPLDPFAISHKDDRVAPRGDRIQCYLPEEIVAVWPEIHLDYLKSRRFDPDHLITKYQLKAVYNVGDYRFRIIAPVFLNQKMVSFVAADVLRNDSARIPYLNCSKEKSIIPINHCFYNLDSVKGGQAIIVEGITDVWRLGDGAIASFTSNYSSEQILLLARKKIQKAFVLYDPDAIDKATRLCDQLSGIISIVELIRLSGGDPADMTDQEVKYMRKDLLGE